MAVERVWQSLCIRYGFATRLILTGLTSLHHQTARRTSRSLEPAITAALRNFDELAWTSHERNLRSTCLVGRTAALLMISAVLTFPVFIV